MKEYDTPEQYEDSQRDESGFSEEQEDIASEIQAGEWQNLRNYPTYKRRSRQWKILATYKAISHRLVDLESMYYRLVGENQHAGAKLLEELKKLRFMQKVLRHCLTWEGPGEVTAEMVPAEVWELIK